MLNSKSGPEVEETVVRTLRRTSSGCSGTPNIFVSSSEKISYYRNSSATGESIPGFRKLQKSGALLPMTRWSQYLWEYRGNPGSREYCDPTGVRYKWDPYYENISGWLVKPTAGDLQGMLPSLDLQYLVQKAASRIYSSGWDALTFLAEIKQLRNMLQGIGKKLEKLSVGESPGRLTDLWLEGRYGWRTLMYDIQDLAEVLTTVKEKRTRYRQSTGESIVVVANTSVDVSSGTWITTGVSQTTITVNSRATVVADIDVPDFQFNPFTTAWEVTRLSFVVDWLFNVGQALEAASFLLRAKSYVACGGYRADFVSTGYTMTKSAPSPWVVYSNNASYDAKGYIEERVPSNVSSIPQMKLRLDKYKVLDLLSLIAQRVR